MKRHLWVLCAALLAASPLAAQSRLYVFDSSDGQYHRVVRVKDDRPFFLDKGALVGAGDARVTLRKADEYAPLFIAVNHKEVDVSGGSFLTQTPSASVNRAIHFKAELVSPYWLDDVFLVLELEFSDGATSILVREVGKLAPRVPLPYEADIGPLRNSALRQCKVHLFAQGSEVVTSEQPLALREESIGRMIRTRIGSAQQAGPRPLLCPAPSYPEELRKSGVKGRAVVALRISPDGSVAEPAVESATDPAFGEAALSAVREWRFVPGVKEGRPVETRVAIPFGFDPSTAAVR